MSDTSTRTYQTRIIDGFDQPLPAYASLMAHVEHRLFADIQSGKKAKDLKSSYITYFQITARQFNATRVKIEGKIEASIIKMLMRISWQALGSSLVSVTFCQFKF